MRVHGLEYRVHEIEVRAEEVNGSAHLHGPHHRKPEVSPPSFRPADPGAQHEGVRLAGKTQQVGLGGKLFPFVEERDSPVVDDGLPEVVQVDVSKHGGGIDWEVGGGGSLAIPSRWNPRPPPR